MSEVTTHVPPERAVASRGPRVRQGDGLRATIGCIQLPTDLTLDQEGPRLVSRLPGVSLRLQKVRLDGEALDLANYGSGRGRIREAAATLLPRDSVDVLGLACTSLAFTLGRDAVQAELAAAHPGARVTDMATAVIEALQALEVRSIALLTPYLDELHGLNLRLLSEAGIEVLAHRNLGLVTDREISGLDPESVAESAAAIDHPDADALMIGCSAFRACGPGFVDALEERLGKPVVTSQQAFLWHLLRLAGIDDALGGYGRLLRLKAPAPRGDVAPTPGHGTEDVYPSRVPSPALVRRVDRVTDATGAFGGPFTEAALRRYDARGYAVLRQVFTPEEVARLHAATESLRTHYEALSYEELDRTTDMRVITERGGSLVDDDGEGPTLKSIWQIHLPPEHAPHMRDAGEVSWRTVRDARLVDAARQILGEEVYVHQSRINYQPGWSRRNRGGSGFLWHQDFEQWHCEDGMPRMRAVSMAVLLERAVPANGALMVMPGSHRELIQAFGDPGEDGRYAKGALSRGPVLPDDLLADRADRFGIDYCRGEPGDVVIFDCNLVHGSHTNISPWGRCMFFAVYNAVSNVPAPRPYSAPTPRPEHIGSHDPRWAGVALPALHQSLAPSAP